jgi:chromosome segregation protein
VIVTHQQQTMQAADLLYGVTMDPGESSRVLAKRLAAV